MRRILSIIAVVSLCSACGGGKPAESTATETVQSTATGTTATETGTGAPVTNTAATTSNVTTATATSGTTASTSTH